MARRDERQLAAPIIRIEQLYPWPEEAIGAALDRFPSAEEVVWLQEEPANMGPWPFAHVCLHRMLGDRSVWHVSRQASASPATGSQTVHGEEQEALLDAVFDGVSQA
jgi:2-oxoglutarate dehydrogenase E1 component